MLIDLLLQRIFIFGMIFGGYYKIILIINKIIVFFLFMLCFSPKFLKGGNYYEFYIIIVKSSFILKFLQVQMVPIVKQTLSIKQIYLLIT